MYRILWKVQASIQKYYELKKKNLKVHNNICYKKVKIWSKIQIFQKHADKLIVVEQSKYLIKLYFIMATRLPGIRHNVATNVFIKTSFGYLDTYTTVLLQHLQVPIVYVIDL